MATNSGATQTLFITAQYVRDNSVINDNTEGNLINKAIRTAQDKYIQPIIGSNLYSTLINQINAGTIAGNYKVLLDNYIIPCLLEYTIYEFIPYSFKFRNKGISKQTSPDSEAAGLDDLYYMRDNIRETAQFYGESLIKYLKVNAPSFPEYAIISADQIKPAQGDYFSGIHIPGSNRNNDSDFGLGIGIPINI